MIASLLNNNETSLIRIFAILLGACSIVWAEYTFKFHRMESAILASAQSILSGERYSTRRLDELRIRLNATASDFLTGLALEGSAVIQLRILENEIEAGNFARLASERTEVESSVTAALAMSPNNSFLWLTQYWLHLDAPRREQLLFISYLTGPHEGWIATRRNRVAVTDYPSLPNEITEQVLAEFAGLVRSGLYLGAANSVADASQEIRARLLAQLVALDDSLRRNFAKVLATKNLDEAASLGIDEHDHRPF